MSASILGTVVPVTYCTLSACAALQDARYLRIANVWPISLVLLGLTALALQPGTDLVSHLASFGLVFAGAFGLFAMGWIGGGDAKLLAAVALAFDLRTLLFFLVAVVIAGGLIALLAIIRPGDIKTRRTRRIPYGVPIAIGTIWCVLAVGAS